MEPATIAMLAKATGPKLLKVLGEQLFDAFRENQQRKALEAFQSMCETIATEAEAGDEESAAFLVQRLNNASEETVEQLEWFFRQMLGNLAPSARVVANKLTAVYVAHGRARDTFFVRVGRLLEQAEEEDIHNVEDLFAQIGPTLDLLGPEATAIRVAVADADQEGHVRVHGGARTEVATLPPSPRLVAALQVLRQHRLVRVTSDAPVIAHWNGADVGTARGLLGLFTERRFRLT